MHNGMDLRPVLTQRQPIRRSEMGAGMYASYKKIALGNDAALAYEAIELLHMLDPAIAVGRK